MTDDDVGQPVEPLVDVLAIAEGLVVGLQPDGSAVVVHADQQRAALGVGEAGDGLGDHRRCLLGDLAVGVPAGAGLELDDVALLAGHEPLERQRPGLACAVELLDHPGEPLGVGLVDVRVGDASSVVGSVPTGDGAATTAPS